MGPGPTVLAVDIGATKMAAAVVTSGGEIVTRGTVATAGDNADGVFAGLAGLVDDVVAGAADLGARPAACGVGCAGPMRRGGEAVSPLNVPQWRDYPLRARLVAHTGLAVTVDNDAKALALGEGRWGAAAGVDHFLAMVVSTGVGGGIVLDGRLLDGVDGNAGHIGHVIVEPDGRPCACGGRGCLEAEASGTAIRAVTGRPPSEAPPEVVARAGRLVGRAVASVVALLDLRLALVGGSVALGFGEPFFAAARAELARSARLDFARDARLDPVGLGADGPVLGAASVALATLR